MGHPLTDLIQFRNNRPLVLCSQIQDFQLVRGHLLENLLAPIGQDYRSQHPVPLYQPAKCKLEPSEVYSLKVALHISVSCNASKLKYSAPADPIGVLDVGKVKGFVLIRLVVFYHRWRRVKIEPAAICRLFGHETSKTGNGWAFKEGSQRQIYFELLSNSSNHLGSKQ